MSNFVLGSRSSNSNVFHEMWQILRDQDDLLNSLEAQCIITWIGKCKWRILKWRGWWLRPGAATMYLCLVRLNLTLFSCVFFTLTRAIAGNDEFVRIISVIFTWTSQAVGIKLRSGVTGTREVANSIVTCVFAPTVCEIALVFICLSEENV